MTSGSAGGEPVVTGSWYEFDELALDRILQAALATFSELGYHGASVRLIARRVGVTVPTLYYHHGSKQGLLLALLQASMGDLVWRSASALEEAGAQPLHRFVDLVDCTVRFMCHRRRIARLDAEARYLDRSARAVYAVPRKHVELQLLDVVRQGIATGPFSVDHPVDVNRALLGAYQSITTWYREGGALSPAEIAARYVEFSLDAVRASPGDRDEGLRRAHGRAGRHRLAHGRASS